MTPDIVHVTAGQAGRSWWGPGDMYTFLVTGEESGGANLRWTASLAPEAGRRRTDTWQRTSLTMTQGTIVFRAGDEKRAVSAGESVFVPRGTPHAYRNDGPTAAKMLAVYTPAGMEGWFREVCTPVDDP